MFCCGKVRHVSKKFRLRLAWVICHNCGEKNPIPSLFISEQNEAKGKSKHFSQNSFKWEHKHNFVSDVQPEECNDDSLDVVALTLNLFIV